jgi:hypothetical protein
VHFAPKEGLKDRKRLARDCKLAHPRSLTLPRDDRRLRRGLRMTLGLVLKIAFGVVCFGIGAACLIVAICMLPFISASGAAAPGMFGVFAATFLWIAFLLLRQVRWHND